MRDGGFSFSQVPHVDIPRSVFNRTHTHKTTFDAGYLVPIFVDEALPGDTFTLHANVLARLATPIFPIMDNMVLDFFFFAVPNRLLWDNWQKFMGEQENPGDSTDYLTPILDFTGGFAATPQSIFDYFGLPMAPGVSGMAIQSMPFRAYNLIWNEWFRDENLQDRVPVLKTDGPDPYANYNLLRRGKRHDYFTSCLPWPQKGPSAMLPITGNAAGASPQFTINGFPNGFPGGGELLAGPAGAPSNVSVDTGTSSFPGNDVMQWFDPNLGATINSLRQAFQIQKLLEKDARGGTRYTEILRSHFGVVSPDARLQRPEYLGGGSVPVIVNPVSQTSGTAGTGGYTNTPQGNLAAFGVAAGGGPGFTKSFVEHSVIIGLMCARADITYQQGLHRMWSRRTRYDFYWPSFAMLGEQAVLNKEIYATGNSVNDEAVFGYQERWAEYRYFPSKITGKFRSSDPQSLDAWHLAQEFTALPVLGDTFIQENPPVDRVVAVTDEPDFIGDLYFKMKCVRPMPTYSVPGLVDHF